MKMSLLPLMALGLAAAALPSYSLPDEPGSFIWLNVSLKVVVDPATGAVPATMSDAVLNDAFTDMNRWLANNYRGYRVRSVDADPSTGNFKRIGSTSLTGPSKWYNTDLKPESGQGELDNIAFENTAKANKALYGWNDNAINIYFNNGGYSRANFPWSGRGLIISSYGLLQDDKPVGAAFTQSYKVAGNLLHEIGHWYGLLHTHNPDDVTDTALDPLGYCCGARNELDIRNKIAQANFAKNYFDVSLTAAQRTLIDNTANNGMAYIQLFYDDPAQSKVLTDAERFGPTRFLFTEEQMDKWTGYANGDQVAAASGVTKFLKSTAAAGGTGSRAAPFNNLSAAITAANVNGRDIVTTLPGNYTTTATGILSKPVTIRATRQGSITIRKP